MRNHKMTACFFPTTVCFVDDNRKFLDHINLDLDTRTATYKFFDDSAKALHFLKTEYKADPFIKRCISRTEDDSFDHRAIDINIAALHQEIYNPKRYEQISVLVIDYAMPGMNGAELSSQLRDCGFKIILLTGEANQSRAVELFNEGVIHHFIRKDDPNSVELLKEVIPRLQREYFQDLSEVVISSVTQKSEIFDGQSASCLGDPRFSQFFYELFKKHKLTEYYLLEETGSFLFLDDNGRPSWLLVKSEGDMESADFDTQDGAMKITPALRKSIEKREVLRHYFDNNFSINKSEDWKCVLYPAKKLEGKSNYYYCYVEKPLTEPFMRKNEIVAYSTYLADADAKFFE